MEEDLKANPPIPFDLTRKLKALNYKLSKHRVSLPEEFVRVDDADLKKRISVQLRVSLDGIGAQKVIVEIEDEADEEIQVDEAFIETERNEIEDQFANLLTKKGRVIPNRDWVN